MKDLGIPVKFIGVGEKMEDLRDFEATTFVDALLGNQDSQRIEALQQRALKIIQKSVKIIPDVLSGTNSENSNNYKSKGSSLENRILPTKSSMPMKGKPTNKKSKASKRR